ncbi:MAG: NAD(P)-dependent oxidoreductase [Sphingomonadaceae bacterium]
MHLGFVGVGNMGSLMAPHLLEAGHSLLAYDASPEALERMARAGAQVATSSREVAESTEMVLTSLPNLAVVETVYLGEQGLLEGARPGQILADLSTISASLARKIAARFAAKGAVFLDAPVTGGTIGAKAGTLGIMVGGDAEAVKRAEPVLLCIGKRVFHAGPVGSGCTVKALHQILMGINNAAVLEMMAVALRSGVDLKLLKEVVWVGTGFSRAVETRFDKVAEREFSRGAAVDVVAKDLRLAREMAAELGLELPVVSAALSIYEEASRRGLGLLDVSAAIDVVNR